MPESIVFSHAKIFFLAFLLFVAVKDYVIPTHFLVHIDAVMSLPFIVNASVL